MKRALLTGVGKEGQVGEAVAKRLAADGFELILVDRTMDNVSARTADLTREGFATKAYACDLADEIATLGNQPGGEIIAWGGASLAQSLSRAGIVDEYVLFIQPVAFGSGLPMFPDLPDLEGGAVDGEALVEQLLELAVDDTVHGHTLAKFVVSC